MLVNSHPCWTQRTVLQTGEATTETVEAKQPPTFTTAPRHWGGWDGSRTSSRSGAMAWKPREPPSPTVGWCTRRRALPGPRARGSFKLNYALSDGCLYSPCSILFYYKYLQSVFNLRLPAYIFLSDSNLQRFHQTSVCWRFGANGLILPSPALSCRKRTRHKNLEIHFLHPLIRLYFPSFYIVWTVYFRIHFLNTFWK